MADMGTKEAAEKCGYSQDSISKWCREGLIKGATQGEISSPWHIPQDAECPRPIKIRGDKK